MKDNVEIRAMTAPWYGGIQLLVKTERAVGVNVVMRDVSEAERQRDFRPTERHLEDMRKIVFKKLGI